MTRREQRASATLIWSGVASGKGEGGKGEGGVAYHVDLADGSHHLLFAAADVAALVRHVPLARIRVIPVRRMVRRSPNPNGIRLV